MDHWLGRPGAFLVNADPGPPARAYRSGAGLSCGLMPEENPTLWSIPVGGIKAEQMDNLAAGFQVFAIAQTADHTVRGAAAILFL